MNTNETSTPPLLTVSELTQAIKLNLERSFPVVSLQGEISNCKPNSSGHLYFSLKDLHAQISAVMFRNQAALLKAVPKDGTQVIVQGELNVYPAGGRYQLVVREMRPVGLGELLLKLEELKVKLHKLGWFKKERKREIPKFPKRIGVVTSPTGAAIQDILNILSRRFSGFHLILNPVKVQGEGAAQEIAKAIEQFNEYHLADVLIIGRGGGSFEDLFAFNEEVVAAAIYQSRIPTISAVGHESDHCIADYVADVRAPTPSAAAELVIAEKTQQLNHLAQMHKRIQHTLTQQIRQDKQRLYGVIRHPLFQTPYQLLGPWIQRLDSLKQELDETVQKKIITEKLLLKGKRELLSSLNPLTRLQHHRVQIQSLSKGIEGGVKRQLDLLKLRLKHIKDSLDTVNPKNLLSKGYSIVFSKKDFSAITSVHSVEKGEDLKIILADGTLDTLVERIYES